MFKKDSVIDYFKEYENFYPTIIQRELKVPLDSNFVVSIFGPRRAGKTYYLFQISKLAEKPVYLNFEDSRLFTISYSEVRDILNIFTEVYSFEPKTLLLDEIQNLEKWEVIVRELHDLKKYRIFITGSSSKLLSKEISTRLRGRTLSYLLLPFSFREFLLAKNKSVEDFLTRTEQAVIKSLLREYCEFGGFPDVVLSHDKIKILQEYSDLVLFKDLIERHKIKNTEIARFIHYFIIQNFSKEISVKGLFNKIKTLGVKVSKDTVYNYVSKLEDTAFFFFLRKLSIKPHERESWPKKVYLCDTGIIKKIKFFEDIGRIMENVVFLELMRKTNENPLLEIFYWKDYQQREVDFVIKEGLNVKQLIQVTYASGKDEIDNREVKALIKASEELKCKDLLIITWDYEDEIEIERKRIVFKPLWKWLLGA